MARLRFENGMAAIGCRNPSCSRRLSAVAAELFAKHEVPEPQGRRLWLVPRLLADLVSGAPQALSEADGWPPGDALSH